MKKLNIQLINSILKTDFLFLENKKIKTLKLITLRTNSFNILDIVELHFRLKQFIRVLQFIKKQKNSVCLLNKNKQSIEILKVFLKKTKNMFINSINIHDGFLKNVSKIDYLKLYIYINLKKEIQNTFFNYEINSFINKNNSETYKILNNIDSFNKIIFFLALFQNVLKKYK